MGTTLDERGFWYDGVFKELSDEAILLDGSISENDIRPHVYRDIHAAFESRELAGAELERPLTLYIAPNVYWIDDPSATDTVYKEDGYPLPFGMYINCAALNIVGLSNNSEDIVIAGNRGQSHGSCGNYTMLHFNVERLNVSNITIGNYCSVDLVYPRDPKLDRHRRTEAVTQAQLAIQRGDRLYAENSRFISRLNLCPIGGASKALYYKCHFESTDDALNSNAVYLDCDFDFYGSRPIYEAYGTGAAFIGCLFRSRIKSGGGEAKQYFTKEGGPIALIDCRFESAENVKLGWTKYLKTPLECCQYRVTQNGKPVIIGGADETVMLDGKKALEAYIFEHNGKTIPNIGNLLGGSDEWDPIGVLEAAKSAGKLGIPTMLKLSADKSETVSEETSVSITSECFTFTGEYCGEKVSFSIRGGDEQYITLRQNGGGSCLAGGCNHGAEAKEAVILAHTESGLEAAISLTVEPSMIKAPECVGTKLITCEKSVTLEYELSMSERKDVSEISWFRCDNLSGDGAVLCGVSKLGIPLKTYRFSEADEGKYIKAVISPRLYRSMRGKAVSVITAEPVSERDVDIGRIFTDFSDMPDIRTITNGCWISDCAKPEEIIPNSDSFGGWWMDESAPAWNYGETGNGSKGKGLYQNMQGARLRYAPVHKHGGDMCLTVKADPAKTAGQGFGSAGQYLDIGIKFDIGSLSGYALRIIRVKEASDAAAAALIEYKNGKSRYLTEMTLTSCFVTGCTLKISLCGKTLTATACTDTTQPSHKAGKYLHEITLEAKVDGNPHDGVMIWNTGSTGSGGWQNTVMLHSAEIVYK